MGQPLRVSRAGPGMKPRVIFAGTPAFAATILGAIHAAGWEIPLVLTQPDAPAGRGRQVQDSAVAREAATHSLTVRKPDRIADELPRITAVAADVLLVAAYGQLIPQPVFTAPAHGALNVHASLLPRYRGASPISAALRAGDTETGVSLMRIEAGLDTGPVFATRAVKIRPTDTAGSLTERLAAAGAELSVQEIPRVIRGELAAVPQDAEAASDAPQLTKSDGRIDWSEPAVLIERHIRAMQPWPGAWTESATNRIEILAAEVVEGSASPGHVDAAGVVGTGDGRLRVCSVKPAGRTAMPAADWLRGQAEPPSFG